MNQAVKLLVIMWVFYQPLVVNRCNAAERLEVALLVPTEEGTDFWGMVESFIKAVAEDLNVDLKIYYAKNRYQFSHKKMAEKILTSAKKPDYLISSFEFGTANYELDLIEAAKVGFFSFNKDIHPEEKDIAGVPRGKYKYWLGKMTPDDERVGYDLANYLIAQARKRNLLNDKGQISLLALSGTKYGTILRDSGLRRAVEEDPQVELKQLLYSKWDQKKSYKKAAILMKRYSDISAIWSASDSIALGALQAIKDERLLGRVLTGGIDWTKAGLEAVKNGEFEASFGGHFMEAGWALLLLYDYHHGKDFSSDIGLEIKSKMSVLTSENIQVYLDRFGRMDWRSINFKDFSKVHNPELIKYDFSLEKVLSQK